ncbi:hypothetical protein E1180_19845 [Roseibium denhamense]|uniref:Sulfotransferase family protein n=1 Tax=Roseibium denhamense TaxID=76305 RepID=A0ABY1P355_9HYPH|nr:hypothetical protein [Roseibium denhamense]MTI07760.1 hypothetical protein [Roseibium denhamense]SMP25206.1 hypothetical protein SAMN06265374_2531 [Roseibium denhamense]
MNETKIILHAGAQKTGSTSLQRWFYANEPLLNGYGITCPKRLISEGQVDPVHTLLSRSNMKAADSRLAGEFRQRIAALQKESGHATILLSHETAFGMPFELGTTRFYERAPKRMEAVRAWMPPDIAECRVVFFVRNYAEFLRSSYVQWIRQGQTDTFEDFASASFTDTMDWRPLVSKLTSVFGEKNVQIVDYGAFFEDPSRSLSDVFFRGAIPAGECLGIAKIAVNRSPPMGAVSLARRCNAALARRSQMNKRDIGRLTSAYVMRPFEKLLRVGFGASGHGRILEALDQRYQDHKPQILNACDSPVKRTGDPAVPADAR